MGCDIHMFVEYKVDNGSWKPHKGHKVSGIDDDYWLLNTVSATGRNYSLFAAFAGVRGHGPQPRGLPDDVSETILKCVEDWGADGHSHSWLSLDELENILTVKGYKPTDRTDMFYDWGVTFDLHPPDYTTIVTACKKEAEELAAEAILYDGEPSIMQHRLVFFFDN